MADEIETTTDVTETALENCELAPAPAPKPSANLVPTAAEIKRLEHLAITLSRGRPAPKGCGNWESAFAKMLAGRELGLPPMASIAEIDLIEGKLGLNAIAKVALVRRRGLGTIRLTVSTETEAVATVHRTDWADGEEKSVRFTIDQAKQAGLSNKGNWRNYPQSMLAHRAQSLACKLYFQEVFTGVGYDADELGADTDEFGRPIELTTPTYDDPQPAQDWSAPAVVDSPAEATSPNPVLTSSDVAPPPPPLTGPTADQATAAKQAIKLLGWTSDKWQGWLNHHYRQTSLKQLPAADVQTAVGHLLAVQQLNARMDAAKMSEASRDRAFEKRGVHGLAFVSRELADEMRQKLEGMTTPF